MCGDDRKATPGRCGRVEPATPAARHTVVKRRAGLRASLAAFISLIPLTSCASGEPSSERPSEVDTAETPEPGEDWHWVGIRNVEVLAPATWEFDYEATRPDCIDAGNPRDPWAKDVPAAPYVTIGTPQRAVPAIGCLRERQPGDPGPEFGALPFSLWQPYVKLDQARPDLKDPARTDGEWQYRDWTLIRQTISGVQITVLAPPDRPTLGQSVLSSVRRVRTTSLGCEADSPAAAERFAQPKGAPIPVPEAVETIAVCHYSRIPGISGLDGSRQITGQAAQELVEAIRDAPSTGGPDAPQHCLPDMYGDSALTLRFFGREDSTSPLAEAYVYFDWCFGNGIFDSAGARKLTKANCAPLFARPPVTFWSGQGVVVEACGPLASG